MLFFFSFRIWIQFVCVKKLCLVFVSWEQKKQIKQTQKFCLICSTYLMHKTHFHFLCLYCFEQPNELSTMCLFYSNIAVLFWHGFKTVSNFGKYSRCVFPSQIRATTIALNSKLLCKFWWNKHELINGITSIIGLKASESFSFIRFVTAIWFIIAREVNIPLNMTYATYSFDKKLFPSIYFFSAKMLLFYTKKKCYRFVIPNNTSQKNTNFYDWFTFCQTRQIEHTHK